jgi:hypothetical protein
VACRSDVVLDEMVTKCLFMWKVTEGAAAANGVLGKRKRRTKRDPDLPK